MKAERIDRLINLTFEDCYCYNGGPEPVKLRAFAMQIAEEERAATIEEVADWLEVRGQRLRFAEFNEIQLNGIANELRQWDDGGV